MGKRFQCAWWLASLVLHVVPACILWMQAIHFPNSEGASQKGHTIEVRLHAGSNAAEPDSQSSALPALPATAMQPSVDADAESAAATLDSMPPGDAIFSPARDSPYIPAGQLDTRPYPETPVIIPFPDAPLATSKITAVLVLYIGLDGQVDRVEVTQSDLPPRFEKAAVEAFQQSRMQPGIKNGRATRARMKVQVEFEAR